MSRQDKVATPDTERIAELIEPSLEAMGYSLVRAMLMGGRRPTLQIMAERRDEAPMTVEDCADISRTISAVLDVADPIAGAYSLEVSSPGIDRPLTRRADYERFAGHVAKLELAEVRDGRRRWQGRLLGIEGDDIRLAVDEGEARLPMASVTKAKLVLTDELIAAHQQRDN
jgi:ribosome maturation factor RimP